MKPMARKRWEQPIAGGMTLAGLSYQMFDGDDYDDFKIDIFVHDMNGHWMTWVNEV